MQNFLVRKPQTSYIHYVIIADKCKNTLFQATSDYSYISLFTTVAIFATVISGDNISVVICSYKANYKCLSVYFIPKKWHMCRFFGMKFGFFAAKLV